MPDTLRDLAMMWGCIALGVLGLVSSVAVPYGIFYLISLPMRRQERGRFFVDLLETCLKSGANVEQALVAISHSRDRTLGVRFHLMAAYLETGLRLDQALERVPRLLPPQIVAMLRIGRQLGDLRRVLPACRQLLKDGISQTQGALNYLLVLAFVVTPILPVLFIYLWVFIIPKILMIGQEFMDTLPPFTQWVLDNAFTLICIQLAMVVFFQGLTFAFLGGPRLRGWLRRWLAPATDRLGWALPWRRKRLQRDFAGMLALLLDAEVPEAEAVKLAAAGTSNSIFMRQANEAVRRLAEGVPLDKALDPMDNRGEFRWRLANACSARRGFGPALQGWLEALDAKAFQQEQAAAQLLTTGLVLVNGVTVGLVAVALFAILVRIVDVGVALW